jgi:hypothetical protein
MEPLQKRNDSLLFKRSKKESNADPSLFKVFQLRHAVQSSDKSKLISNSPSRIWFKTRSPHICRRKTPTVTFLASKKSEENSLVYPSKIKLKLNQLKFSCSKNLQKNYALPKINQKIKSLNQFNYEVHNSSNFTRIDYTRPESILKLNNKILGYKPLVEQPFESPLGSFSSSESNTLDPIFN